MSSEDLTRDGTQLVPGTVDERALKVEDRTEPTVDSLVGARYRVARRIGKGGMGEVMAARDEQIGRDVAIKRMRAAAPSERAIKRFLREASIQGRLEHPAIVPVHEIGHDTDGLPFFVMKKLTGTTLAKILDDDKLERDAGRTPSFTQQRVLRAFAEVCLAVELAHVRGVVHRDLKPDNIMLGDFGEVYVLDWGVAKIVGEDDSEFADVDSSGGSGEHATAAGTTIGTPGYMAPEQVRGSADIDGRADIYTLGCLLFEILAGEPLHPRGYEGLQSALLRNDNRPSDRAPGRKIPPELDALCAHATTPDREVRVQTARELGDRVQRYLDGDRDLAMRRGLAREHLQVARDAFAGTTEDHRRTAIQESAAALALDPALKGAAELVGRLMLEPPATTPPEVEQAIVADDVRAAKVNAQAGLLAVIAGLAFIPLLCWMADGVSGYIIALAATMTAMGGISVYNLRSPAPITGFVVIGNTIIVAVLARMYSPLLIAPGMAAVLAMGMVFTPRFSWLGSGASIASSLVIAVVGPWVLERYGVLSPTMSVGTPGLVFQPPAISGEEFPVFVVGGLYMTLLITGASTIGEIMRNRTRAAHRHLLTQAWQLRQLVPRAS
jgi:serine/threonine-protein kinase